MNPPTIHFPQFHPKMLTPFHIEIPPQPVGLYPVVWLTPKPFGTHFSSPHHLAHILQSLESPSTSNPPTIHFPNLLPKYLHRFHRGVPTQHDGLYPCRLVHLKTVFYSFPFTPSLGLYIAVFIVPLHFEPSDHPFPPISPQEITLFHIKLPLSTSDFITVVWIFPKRCGTHFLFTPSPGLHITVFRVTLHFEPSDHPFPPISPQNIHPHFRERSLLSTLPLSRRLVHPKTVWYSFLFTPLLG